MTLTNTIQLIPKRIGRVKERARYNEILNNAKKEKKDIGEQLGPGAYTADNIAPPLHF